MIAPVHQERGFNMKDKMERKRGGVQYKARIFFVLLCLVLIFYTGCKAGGTEDEPLEVPTNTSQSDKQTDSGPWYLTLVNRWNPLPKNYDLELAEVEGGELVDQRIYDPLMEMLEAARAEGLGPIVVSGYRTRAVQQRFMDEKIAEFRQEGYSKSDAEKLAKQWVAIPGTSEHELGLAVDINGDTYDIYPWLQENSYKFGFIFRCPADKKDITGIAEEVWHYRYVGLKAAKEIYESGLCLEEYLDRD